MVQFNRTKPHQPEKVKAVSDLKKQLEAKNNFILISYSGLSVKSMEDLRKRLKSENSNMKVIKNNLCLRAVKESSAHENPDVYGKTSYKGTIAAIFGEDNLPTIAKVCKEFKKTNESFEIKGGYFSGQVLSAVDVESIAGLPSREELLAVIARGINAPATQIAGGINQIIASLARAINLVAEKNGK